MLIQPGSVQSGVDHGGAITTYIHALVHDQFMTIDKLARSTPLQPSAGSCCVDRPMEATTIESTFLRRVCSRTINLFSLFGFTYSRSSHQPARILKVDKISALCKLRSVGVAPAPCFYLALDNSLRRSQISLGTRMAMAT
jgi:hypothetical protein